MLTTLLKKERLLHIKPFTSQVNVNDHKNKTDKSGKGSGRNSGVIM